MNAQAIPVLQDRCFTQHTHDKIFLVDSKHGHRIAVSDSAALILELCDGALNLSQVIEHAARFYDVEPSAITSDVVDLFTDLSARGFIKLEQPQDRYSLDVVTIELTGSCNLSCIHCLFASRSGSMMTPDSLSAAVAGCISASVTEVFFTGGEPTLHPGLVSAAADLKAGGIKRVVVLTNGVLLTDDLALKLKTAGVDEVRVSIDGVTTDTNDPIRGHKTFTQAIDALARLRRLNIRSAIVFTACKPNIADWQALPEFAAAHADQLYAGEIIYFGRAHENERQLALSAEQVADFRAIIARAQASPEPGVTINSSDSIGEYRRGMCAAGRSKCTIAWDGNVIPCSLFDQPEMCAGNLHEDSLPSLWASAAPFQRLRGISAVMIGQCRGCRYRLICGGGCRAKSFVLHGDLVGKPCPTDCLWRTIYFDRMVAEYGAGATEFIGSGAFK